MSDFRFASPDWVYAFWGLLGFVALLIFLERRGGTALDALVSSALRDRLVARPAAWRRRLRVGLLVASLVFGLLALMRPQWGLRYAAAQRASAKIMVCLDVSKSMLAEDVVPNRLERAKAEVADLLSFLDGDQVGLIAFAGRATVLSPMTPDFGFLRLVLDGAGPGSVARGGTRLEEPIRKAVAGFGERGDAARVILLITDGEDQDSFPLRAASEAREAGVEIIGIGFGSEEGSPIWVTDPRSGARTQVRDPDGKPVISRLDGDLLRQIVSETKGVYIPAGTGVLDLESIYREHIAGLLRGAVSSRGRPVREEGYQWALLLAFLTLLGSVGVTGRATAAGELSGNASAPASMRAGVSVVLAASIGFSLALLAGSATLRAQTPDRADDSATQAGPSDSTAGGDTSTSPDSPAGSVAPGPDDAGLAEEPDDLAPRQVYNQSLALLGADDVDTADRLLRRARRDGAADPELRFRSTYNLGLATVRRAQAQVESEPEQALRLLYEAADRFREASRQHPDDLDSRQNLEVTLRQALLLADELAQKKGDLGEELAALAQAERSLAAGVTTLLRPENASSSERSRRDYRAVAGQQRVLLADADALASRVGAERDAIDRKPAQDRSTEEQARLAQLAPLLDHLYRARERMGQARSQLRRRQGERAYRRTAGAIAALERAQDQLRPPPELLSRVLQDATLLGRQTAALALARRGLPGTGAEVPIPEWLTPPLLQEQQDVLAERTGELASRIDSAGAAAESAQDDQEAGLPAALPFIRSGETAFRAAARHLGDDALESALSAQSQGVQALLEARERLLGIKGLIELAVRQQRGIGMALTPAKSDDAGVAANPPDPDFETLAALQRKNLERTSRLDGLLQKEQTALESAAGTAQPQAPGGAGSGAPDPKAVESQRQRFALARKVLVDARQAMQKASRSLANGPRQKAGAISAARRANEQLELLRRLFFSVTELLRETAQRQQVLGDDTQDLAARAAQDQDTTKTGIPPLRSRQRELAAISSEIATSLEDQSRQGVTSGQDREPQAQQASEQLRRAAELVLGGSAAMEAAVASFDAATPDLKTTRGKQDEALEALAQAIALLVPPEQRQQPKPESQPSPDQEGQKSGQNGGAQEDPGASQERGDPAQLLQAVRDREAQRRRDRQQRRTGGYETVERDW